MPTDMKRWLGYFLSLMVFGVIVSATADEMRNRPEWRQWLLLAFWAAIAAMIFNWVIEDARKENE